MPANGGGASTNGETSDERTEVLDFPLQPEHSGLARIFYLLRESACFLLGERGVARHKGLA
jgi:hypothetical protein